MVPTGFQVGHRSFGVKELVSGPATKRKGGMKFSTGSVIPQIPEGRKRFYSAPGHVAT